MLEKKKKNRGKKCQKLKADECAVYVQLLQGTKYVYFVVSLHQQFIFSNFYNQIMSWFYVISGYENEDFLRSFHSVTSKKET